MYLKYFLTKKKYEDYYFNKILLNLGLAKPDVKRSLKLAKKLWKVNSAAYRAFCGWLDDIVEKLMVAGKGANEFEAIADLYGRPWPMLPFCLKERLFRLAVKYYEKAIDSLPSGQFRKEASLWFSIAECFQDINQWQDAISAYINFEKKTRKVRF